jgi:hypothetical protein
MCKTCKSKDCCCEQKIVYTSEPKIIEKIIVEKQCPGPRGLTGPRGPIGPEGPAGEGTTDYISEITASATYYNYFLIPDEGVNNDSDPIYIRRESDETYVDTLTFTNELEPAALDLICTGLSTLTGETWDWEEALHSDFADDFDTTTLNWRTYFKIYCTSTSVLDYDKIMVYNQSEPWNFIIPIYRNKVSDVLTITGVGNAFNGTLELPVHPRNTESYISRVYVDGTTLNFVGFNDGFNGVINIFDLFRSLGTYADDAAAGVGGLVQGDIYQTATGELRIKL